ncbi:MAG: CDP-diacylglycerol--serine O-phosphatidyltransferase [Bacteroidetes bacterium]|nr:MAG: CDP-diacylglycerol--serine O-phosphatidyltransferase [Bacteroidota bacterium]
MQIKKQIPNTITLFNLISGSIAIVFAVEGQLELSAWMIGIAAIFDFFDGFAARLLKVTSEVGKELDSLADVISFGLAPGMILFSMLSNTGSCPEIIITERNIIPFIAFLIPAFSAYRLAKFNLDTRQTDSFIGLPTPANALLIASFPLIISQENNLFGIDMVFFTNIITHAGFLIPFIFLFSWLLIAEIPLMSLKFKTFKWGDNNIRYVFLIASLLLFIFFLYLSVPLIILLYLLLSFFGK